MFYYSMFTKVLYISSCGEHSSLSQVHNILDRRDVVGAYDVKTSFRCTGYDECVNV